MNWTELLRAEADDVYRATEGLLEMVDDSMLEWTPPAGENWMTLGQLAEHLTTALGACFRGFVTGDWGMPGGDDPGDAPPEDALPAAARMPKAKSVESVRERLDEDRFLAHRMLEEAGEEDLANKQVAAPWAPDQRLPLGRHLLHMVDHLALHKAQLFYYLKLMGKPVHTGHLWGM